MKRPASLIIRETQTKTRRGISSPARMAVSKGRQITRPGKAFCEKEPQCTFTGMQMGKATMKHSMTFTCKNKKYDPTVPLLGIYLNKVRKDIRPLVYNRAKICSFPLRLSTSRRYGECIHNTVLLSHKTG